MYSPIRVIALTASDTMKRMPRKEPWSPTDALSERFFSGDYEALVRDALSAASRIEHPAVIGALAMVGRLDEAIMAANNVSELPRSREEESTGLFFLCMGFCHGGRYAEAAQLAAKALLNGRRGSPYCRFLGWQAAALVRYFEGRMRNAVRCVKRALAHALASNVPYARLIALDLHGHAMAQLGELQRGIRALRDAESLATELGFTSNASTARASRLIYSLRLETRRRSTAVAELEQLVVDDRLSRFARRNALLHLALVAALEGSAQRAEQNLRSALELCLESDDRRGASRAATVSGAIRALQGTPLAIAPDSQHNDGLAIETAYLCALFRQPIDVEKVRELWRKTSVDRARIALAMAGETEDASNLDWPSCAVVTGSTDRLAHVIDSGALALVPLVLGRVPGKRIYIESTRWILESRGDVCVVDAHSQRANHLLCAIAGGAQTKSELLAMVWNLRGYNPALHDSTIHKLVSRVRKGLGRCAEWLATNHDGYSLAEGVEVVDLRDASVRVRNEPTHGAKLAGKQNKQKRALAAAAQLRIFSCGELAARLSISQATARRLLRPLLDSGIVTRDGAGKNTRYHLTHSRETTT